MLRVLAADGTRVRDLPPLAAVSREAVSVSLGLLQRTGHAAVGPGPAAGQAKLARLTPKGRRAQAGAQRLLAVIEERWQERFGAPAVAGLRVSLQALYETADAGRPLLSEGLVPYQDGWRAHPPYRAQTLAMIEDPAGALPYYPVVSHRGGFPDGS